MSNARNLAKLSVDSNGDIGADAFDNISIPVTSVAGKTGDVTLASTDISGLGTAATTNSTAYATAAQGALADSAIQAADLGTAAYTASTAYATAAQGALADSALQSYTETDPVYVASSWYGTTNNASNWDTAYGWGNHASAGYLTSVNGASVTTFTATTLNATTVDLGNWTITESGGVLYFATSGTNKMKLDASGNLTVVGEVTAYGSV